MVLRVAQLLRPDASLFDPVVERAGDVVSGDDLERDHEFRRLAVDPVVVGDYLDPAHAHPVPALNAAKMSPDPEVLDDLKPVGRRPTEGLALVWDERGDDLVEHTD